MTTQYAPPPPPAPPAPGAPGAPGAGGPQPPSAAPRVIAILAIVFGGIVVLGSIGSAIVGTLVSASVQTTSRTVAAADVSELDVDVSAGTLRIEYGDVTEAELEVTGSWGADRWQLEQEGGTLVVATPDRWGWFGPWWPWDGFNGRMSEAVLRLPASVEGADATLALSAGDLTVDGEFGALALDLSAGALTVSGTAESLVADVSAGRGNLQLDDVETAELSVSAGGLDVELSGTAPDDVRADVSAGSLNLTVPDGEYDVTSDVSVGDLDNRIGSTPGAPRTIHIEVSAGDATLRAL